MRASPLVVLTASLALTLATGCSRGLAPYEEGHDGGVANHLGDGPISIGNNNSGGGGGLTPADGGSTVPPPSGGGTGTGTGVCGTDVSTGDTTVDACLGSYCCAYFTPCYNDPACQGCMYGTGTGCESNSAFLALDDCWATSCDSGSGGGGGTGAGLCGSDESTGDTTVDACLDSNCCTEFDACYTSATCQACMYGTGSGCASNSSFLAFDGCWTSACDSGSGGGTTAGNGVCDSGESTGDDLTDACLSATCCTEFDACYNDASCMECLYGTGSGCSYNSNYVDFDDCWYYSC